MLNLSRRKFTQSLAAVGVAAAALSRVAIPQTKRQRIDVHHHILPPEYVAIVGEKDIGGVAPNRAVPKWDVARSIAAMDQNEITSAVVSVSSPGMVLDRLAQTRRLARASNEFAAQMVSDYPTRYGMFASLPMLDREASLLELDYALDVLKADGVVLMTNYRDRYLGEPEFAKIFDELNARKAVVYVHPTTCDCSADVLRDNPASMIEFPHDTTRTITSLLFSGTFSRCPDIRFIFSHAGGTLPFLANRIATFATRDRSLAALAPGDVFSTFRRLYFDTASSANPMTFGALMQLVKPSQVLLGTDFPFVEVPGMRATIEGLRHVDLDEASIRAIEGENAAGLFPRLKGAGIG